MIPFNRATFTDTDLAHLASAVTHGHTAGNGPLTLRAQRLLEEIHGGGTALLTTSCSHALELSARLLDLQPGDEVIVPSYTFVTSASSFIWNGATPVFADVDPHTLNMDLASAEALINDNTRAICLVHYAGVGASPDQFEALARRHGLTLIEDNAHGLGASFGGRKLGTFGAMSTLSFHETKNITCGEGGAIIINDPALIERAEILREKGTDRSKFMRGQVDKYTWVDVGSSWVLSDLLAGLLVGQLERFEATQRHRIELWNAYRDGVSSWAAEQGVAVPVVPPQAEHSGHMYFLQMPSLSARDAFIAHLREHDIMAVFHYQSLHTSPVGVRLGEQHRACPNSDHASQVLVRLPLFNSLTQGEVERIIDVVTGFRL